MAILWEQTIDANCYQVRSAGRTVRLYKNNVLHTQYKPHQPITDSIWDLLALPIFFHAPVHTKRVLMLGLGGGAAVHLVQAFCQPQSLVAVELDPLHLKLAKKYFQVQQKNVRLIAGDGICWLSNYRGQPFDLIIEDLYGEVNDEPQRALPADKDWMLTLAHQLSDTGTLVINFTSRAEIRGCGYFASKQVAKLFPSAFQFTHPRCENRIGVFLRSPSSAAQLKFNLANHSQWLRNAGKSGFRYAIRSLKS